MIAWIQLHPLIILLIIGTAFTLFWLLKHKEFLKLKWYTAIPVAIAHTVWGVLCVKAFAVAETGFNAESVGNMSLFGGVFFMPVFYYLMSKIFRVKAKTVFDTCTICMIFTVMCARINCIFSGCCYGNHLFGVPFRWPTREAEIIFYIILMIWIVRKLKASNTNGMIYPVCMMDYGIFRFICEFFRYSDNGMLLHRAHMWAILSFLIGFSVYVQIESKYKKAIKGRRYSK